MMQLLVLMLMLMLLAIAGGVHASGEVNATHAISSRDERQLAREEPRPSSSLAACLPLTITPRPIEAGNVMQGHAFKLVWKVAGPGNTKGQASRTDSTVARVTLTALDTGAAFRGAAVLPSLRRHRSARFIDGGRTVVWDAVDLRAKSTYKFKVKVKAGLCATGQLRFLAAVAPLDPTCPPPPAAEWTVSGFGLDLVLTAAQL